GAAVLCRAVGTLLAALLAGLIGHLTVARLVAGITGQRIRGVGQLARDALRDAPGATGGIAQHFGHALLVLTAETLCLLGEVFQRLGDLAHVAGVDRARQVLG